LNTLVNACDMLRAAVPLDPLAEAVHQAANAMGVEIEALRRSRSMPPEAEIEQLAARVDRVERALLSFDATVPMLLFRRRVDLELFPPSVVADYVMLLAAHFGEDKDRRDRIDLLVTQICSEVDRGERRKLRPRSEVEALLRRISCGHRCPPDRREVSVAFFEKARWKIAAFKDPEEVFSSGLFSDVYGLKVALGADFLDPEILYATIEANITLRNQLAKKTEEDQTAREIEESEEAKQALLTSHDTRSLVETSRFEKLRAEEVRDDPLSHRAWAQIRRRWVLRGVGAVVAALGAYVVMSGGPPSLPTSSLDSSQLAAISDSLASAKLVGSGPSRSMLAELHDYGWLRLDEKERRALAEKIAKHLQEQQGLQSALLRVDGKMAAKIDKGKVVILR